MEQSLVRLIQNEEFVFDCRRAIYWPRRKILVMADLHWGKTQYMRQHGVAISDNVFEADLQRLSHLLDDYETNTVLVLGDLIHHEKSLSKGLIEKVAWFRHEHPCEFVLVKGNHDRFTHFPESWGIVEESSFYIDHFYFVHEQKKKVKDFQFSGHIHPMLRLRSGFDELRLPSFILSDDYCLLPAFSYLTGGQDIKLQKGEEGMALTEEGLESFKK